MLANTRMPYSRLVRYGVSKSVMDGGVMGGKRSGRDCSMATVLRRNLVTPTHKIYRVVAMTLLQKPLYLTR